MTAKEECFLGFDIGGTKSAIIAGTANGVIQERSEWPSQAERGPEFMLDELCRNAEQIRSTLPSVRGIGVSIGGPVDAEKGVVYEPPNLPGWKDVPLRRILEERFALPVNVEHDAAACAYAEYLWGLECVPRRLIYLTCATGFGAGMIFDGVPYYGVYGRSPEVGHVLFDPAGPEAFGQAGCAEAFCSARSLGRLAQWRFPHRWPVPPEPLTVEELWRQGDADAEWVIQTNASMTGRTCALLGDLLHPDHIALGSLARYLGDPWINTVRESFAQLALPDVVAHCRIEAARLGNRLQDLSALAAAIRVFR